MARSVGIATPWFSTEAMHGHPVGTLYWIGPVTEAGKRIVVGVVDGTTGEIKLTEAELMEFEQAD